MKPEEHQKDAKSEIALDALRRVQLDGDVHELHIQVHRKNQIGWIQQSAFTIQRIPDAAETRTSIPETTFDDERLLSRVKIGAKTYQSTTFYHRATGLLVHRMLCDHPGSLHVRAADLNASPSTAMRLLPFESNLDLHTNQQVVRGEGECAIVISFHQEIEPCWKNICAQYDPEGGQHPDIIRVIEKLDQEAQAQNLHSESH